MRRFCATTIIGLSICTAQQTPTTAIPNLIRYSGTLKDVHGTVGVTFAIYKEQDGGAPVWQEAQNVAPDAHGQYAIVLGGATAPGLPDDLFSQQEQRWLGVQIQGQAEQARVLLMSVPYAIKAHDSETLGGLPASAYMKVPATDASSRIGTDTAAATSSGTPIKPKAVPQNNGQPNYIGKFINTTDLVDSAMYEVGGNVGIFTTSPAISLDVRTGTLPQMGIAGKSDYLTFFASDQYGPAIYWDPAKDMRFGKGGARLYNPFGFVEYMRIQSSSGNVGIGTQTPGSKLDVAGDINLAGNIQYRGSLAVQVSGDPNDNTALGLRSLANITTGNSNTSVGVAALQYTTTGYSNTATGSNALWVNISGSSNTATGTAAMFLNSTGHSNAAFGDFSLSSNTTGFSNTAIGHGALLSNITGFGNIAIGAGAAVNVSSSGLANIHIGNVGSAGDNNTIRIGASGEQSSFFAAGIRGVTTTNNDAIPVMIDSAGQLGTVSSSRRFKEDIADMGDASRELMRLRPVTYRYKKPFADGSKPIQYGLIAEEVAEVYPDLVAHSADGQIETVKYQVLDSMLLNEVQRQQAEIRSLQEQINELKTALASVASARISTVQ